MGKDPDEVQHRIVEKRHQIEARMQDVRSRVADDIQGLRGATSEQASDAVGKAKSMVDVENHPYSVLAGALGLGVVLGIASEVLGGGSSPHGARPSSMDNSSGSNALGGVFASIFSVAGDTMKDEISQFVREGMSGLRAAARGEETRRAA